MLLNVVGATMAEPEGTVVFGPKVPDFTVEMFESRVDWYELGLLVEHNVRDAPSELLIMVSLLSFPPLC